MIGEIETAIPTAVLEEYRTAYRQLLAAQQRAREVEEQADADLRLAAKRYDMARAAYAKLALGEDDCFAGDLEVGAG